MKKHLFTILIGATSMVASSPARAQSIVATHDAYGHTVWVASDEAKPQPKPQTPQPAIGCLMPDPAARRERLHNQRSSEACLRATAVWFTGATRNTAG